MVESIVFTGCLKERKGNIGKICCIYMVVARTRRHPTPNYAN